MECSIIIMLMTYSYITGDAVVALANSLEAVRVWMGWSWLWINPGKPERLLDFAYPQPSQDDISSLTLHRVALPGLNWCTIWEST